MLHGRKKGSGYRRYRRYGKKIEVETLTQTFKAFFTNWYSLEILIIIKAKQGKRNKQTSSTL